MRVEVESRDKGKKQESSLPLLMAFLSLFGVAYVASTPEIASYFPVTVERALTSMRKEIDGGLDGLRQKGADLSYMFSR